MTKSKALSKQIVPFLFAAIALAGVVAGSSSQGADVRSTFEPAIWLGINFFYCLIYFLPVA